MFIFTPNELKTQPNDGNSAYHVQDQFRNPSKGTVWFAILGDINNVLGRWISMAVWSAVDPFCKAGELKRFVKPLQQDDANLAALDQEMMELMKKYLTGEGSTKATKEQFVALLMFIKARVEFNEAWAAFSPDYVKLGDAVKGKGLLYSLHEMKGRLQHATGLQVQHCHWVRSWLIKMKMMCMYKAHLSKFMRRINGSMVMYHPLISAKKKKKLALSWPN